MEDHHDSPIPASVTTSSALTQQSPPRPHIDYSSSSAFFKSLCARWKSIWTRQFILSLAAGQIVSLCITCTNVTTTELVNYGLSLPTMQNNFTYFALFFMFTPYTVYKYGIKGWANLVLRDGWRYFVLAACDVEANFFAVKAYFYTDLLSCMLLVAWATPVCLFFSWVYMKPKYHWTQILGVLICMGGLGLLVASDLLTGKNWKAVDKGKGDAFMVAAGTLYGFSNATEELFVRKRPLHEVVGQLGMFGFIINTIQASLLEYKLMKNGKWSAVTVALILAYTAAMLVLYTVSPLLYRLASSTYYNLSLLSSNFYGLLFGLLLYHYKPFWLYFVSFLVVMVGLITFFWTSTPEEQGVLDPQAPAYIHDRKKQDGNRVVVSSLARD
ncbi:hypothetical protein AX14_010966 [Amanita brunnescens Koide BX004]|nr:hypothetical protein AX14_010966 [Amanita brunnescens Koide BX004]